MSLSGPGRSDWTTWGFFYPVRACIGSFDEMADKLLMIREETDISYMVFEPTRVETFDIFANKVIPALS